MPGDPNRHQEHHRTDQKGKSEMGDPRSDKRDKKDDGVDYAGEALDVHLRGVARESREEQR